MLRIKRLYLFMLQTFFPVFIMTFFICLFIVLMQFLWKYIDDMVGKGLEISVLAEFFFYAAVTLVPMALPLALLLASLMTFGNLGERLELLAMKASGISLLRIMYPLIVTVVCISIGAFFFSNDILPISQKKLWALFVSMKQKSPELDIPEGSFYDQVSGFNIYVQHKNKETGMLYDMMIYDFSGGFDDAMVIAADSGKLVVTDDKKYLFLTLYTGESFENLKGQRSSKENIPYRRETFDLKEILIEFDANFNRFDEGIMQDQYSSKNLSQLAVSIDSLSLQNDSIGNINAKSLLGVGYFSLYNDPPERIDSIARAQIAPIKIDTLVAGYPLVQQQLIVERALQRAQMVKQEYEYKSIMLSDQLLNLRRHLIEYHRKFTLSIACLIFFFIGAPLGAIIRKGGIGLPIVISVILFIFYYIIDNTGYKMARDGVWEVWQGTWLSTAVLFPLGIFLTYKSINDSVILNADTYTQYIKHLFTSRQREFKPREIIFNEVSNAAILGHTALLSTYVDRFLLNVGNRPQSYFNYWRKGYDLTLLKSLSNSLEALVVVCQDSRDKEITNRISIMPVIVPSLDVAPFRHAPLGLLFSLLLFPVALPLYAIGRRSQKRLLRHAARVRELNHQIYQILT